MPLLEPTRIKSSCLGQRFRARWGIKLIVVEPWVQVEELDLFPHQNFHLMTRLWVWLRGIHIMSPRLTLLVLDHLKEVRFPRATAMSVHPQMWRQAPHSQTKFKSLGQPRHPQPAMTFIAMTRKFKLLRSQAEVLSALTM